MALTKIRVLFIFGILFVIAGSAMAFQEIRETVLVNKILKENTDACHQVLKSAYYMREQTLPFIKPKYQAKFRFHPDDKNTRRIMSLSRNMRSSFKMLSGILYHAEVKNRDQIFKTADGSLETLAVSAKRALRAIRDGNHELYLVSAETANREALNIQKVLEELENNINESIEKSDNARETM